MKLVKKGSKQFIKMSYSEWEAMGKEAGWIDNLENLIEEYLPQYAEKLWSGIRLRIANLAEDLIGPGQKATQLQLDIQEKLDDEYFTKHELEALRRKYDISISDITNAENKIRELEREYSNVKRQLATKTKQLKRMMHREHHQRLNQPQMGIAVPSEEEGILEVKAPQQSIEDQQETQKMNRIRNIKRI